MGNREGAARLGRAAHCHESPATFHFALPALMLAALLAGCASPGDPYERKSLVPEPVADLAASQSGSDVILTFTLPKEAVDHRPLETPPAIEVFRDFEESSGAANTRSSVPSSTALLITIPAAMEDQYSEQGHIRYTDSLHADHFARHPNAVAVYTVRTYVSEKIPSAASNGASTAIPPAPDPVADVKAQVTHSAIVLTWTAPQTADGSAPPISAYSLYRAGAAPVAPGAPVPSTGDLK